MQIINWALLFSKCNYILLINYLSILGIRINLRYPSTTRFYYGISGQCFILYPLKHQGDEIGRLARDWLIHLWTMFPSYEMRCVICYYFYNLKNMKNTHGCVLLLIKLQAKACNFTKNNAAPQVFFTLFKLCKW